ncbi:MAG: hypothetical protein GVY15_09585 [Bacteroidetes bacterium]|jgi:hypothetical protein|nr:hypothetical protein [Bacteroidota bacterium]
MTNAFRIRCAWYPSVLLLLVFGIGVLPAPHVLAQEREEAESHALQAGAWALQFSVGENFTLNSFLGSTISGKRHVSDARAWQAALTLRGRATSEEDERGSVDDGSQALDLTVRYLSYPLLGERPTETIQLYIGAGPNLMFDRRTFSRESSEQESSTDRLMWSLGVSGTVGAEWFVHPRISLSGAYETALRYRRQTIEQESEVQEVDETRSTFELSPGGVRFGVSVYF